MTNVTNLLLAQMLMARPHDGESGRAARPDQGRPPGTRLANINVQEIPTTPVPLPSWNDTESLYYWYKLLNPAPLRDQSVLLDKEPGPEMLSPTPLSPQPEMFGDPLRFPRPDLFDRRFRPQDR